MNILLFALIVMLLLPVVVAISPLQEGDAHVEARIVFKGLGERFAFHDTTDPTQEDPGTDVANRCQTEAFQPRGQGFSFHSGPTEMTCGLSVWTVDVPEGTKQATVSFHAQRDVQPGVSGGPVHAIQEFAVYTQEWDLIKKLTLFPAEQAGHMDRTFDVALPLTGQMDYIHMVWIFDDQGTMSLPGLSPTAGGSFNTNVDKTSFVVDNVPLATSPAPFDADTDDEASVSFQIPAKWFISALDASIEIFVSVHGDHGGHRVILPSGQEMAAEQLHAEPRDAPENGSSPVYTLHLPPAFIKAAGAGEYTIRLEPTSAMTATSGGSIFAAAWTFIPIAVAFFATAALYLRPRDEKKKGPVQTLLPLCGFFAVATALVWLTIAVGPGRLFSWSPGPHVLGPMALLLAWTLTGTAIVLHRLWNGSKDQVSAQKTLIEERECEKTARIDAQEALYTLAHDLKTPVVTLDYLVDELAAAQDGRIDRDHQVSLGRTRQVISEMDKRITAMMDFARGADQLQEPGEVHVQTAVEQSAQMLKPHCEKKGTKLEIESSPDTWLSVSPDSFDHVIANLVDNAIKYGPEKDGIVHVRWRDRGRSKRTGGLVLEVADNGPGIARQDRERIFKLLTRLPDPDGRELPGTGVGLAVVHRIIASQQGRIEVAHAPEGGTLMRVIWPPSRVVRAQKRRADDPKSNRSPRSLEAPAPLRALAAPRPSRTTGTPRAKRAPAVSAARARPASGSPADAGPGAPSRVTT